MKRRQIQNGRDSPFLKRREIGNEEREREDSQNLHYFSIANCAGSFVKYTGNFKCKCSRRKYQSCPCNNAQRECANGEFTVSFWFGKWAVKFVIIYIYIVRMVIICLNSKRKRLLEIKMWALPSLYPCGGECTTINVGNEMEKFFHFSFFFLVYSDLKFAAAMRLAATRQSSHRSIVSKTGRILGAEKQAFHGVSSCFGRRFRPRLLNLVRCPKPPSWNNPLSAFKLFRKLFKARANASSYFPPRRRTPPRLLNHPVVPLKDIWSFVKSSVFVLTIYCHS